MSDGRIHVKAGPPYRVQYVMTSDGTVDLSLVTAAVFRVSHSRGRRGRWAATFVATPTQIVMTHVFAPGDVPDVGTVTIMPELTLAGGQIVGEAKTIQVVKRSEV